VLTVCFTFTDAEIRRMARYGLLRSRGPILLLAAGIAILAIGAGTGKSVWFAVAGAELVGWAALVFVAPRVGLRGTGDEQTLSFSEEGVTAANARGSQRFDWNHWRRWSVARELYLLRGAGSVFTFVPRRAFASEDAESEFRALLARHLAATRRLA